MKSVSLQEAVFSQILNSISGWNVPVTQENLLEFFEDYHPRFKRLLQLTDNIHLWQMRVVPRLDTWINKRVCLLGDSAHASLPSEVGLHGMSYNLLTTT